MRLALAFGLSLALAWATYRFLEPAFAPAAGPPAPTAAPAPAAGGSTIRSRFAAPDGFRRVEAAPGSFAAHLASLPLKPGNPAVRLHDGRPKPNQLAHAAVLDLEVGPRNLLQCADAVIRFRAEYLHAAGRADEISFRFTNGFACGFRDWARGRRVRVEGNLARWIDAAAPGGGREQLGSYLDAVYAYAGTLSLSRELEKAAPGSPVGIGDVFLVGGSPGHAAIVADVAQRGEERAFLLVQGYLPAQDLHVLRNPADPEGGPWYRGLPGAELLTPEWTFPADARYRFPGP